MIADMTDGYCNYCLADQGHGYGAVYGGSSGNYPSPFPQSQGYGGSSGKDPSPFPSPPYKNKISITNKKQA